MLQTVPTASLGRSRKRYGEILAAFGSKTLTAYTGYLGNIEYQLPVTIRIKATLFVIG